MSDDRYEYGGYDDDWYEYGGSGYDDDDDWYEYSGSGYDEDDRYDDDRYDDDRYDDDRYDDDRYDDDRYDDDRYDDDRYDDDRYDDDRYDDSPYDDSPYDDGGIWSAASPNARTYDGPGIGPHDTGFLSAYSGFIALSHVALGTSPAIGDAIHSVVSAGGGLSSAARAVITDTSFNQQFNGAATLDDKIDVITVGHLGLGAGSEAHAVANDYFESCLNGGMSVPDLLMSVVSYLLDDGRRLSMFDQAAETVLGGGSTALVGVLDADDLGGGAGLTAV
ncbi:hypothetical protein [Roseospira goensis]|uniref:Uncharacterized protein n=1 Tax=Roseospira goensis TaxID=391922 RepID=A0A7W6WK46_9PROT|nr:hypothetical protein [Roseospira goensis]MBB4285961.1 hypothetical protein [Roseospira goensis]